MEIKSIIAQLASNKKIIANIFSGVAEVQYQWKPFPEHWSLIEVISHLLDEEKEDFRARIKYTIDQKEPHKINPGAWVAERKYSERDYNQTIEEWIQERTDSIEWLKSLDDSNWDISYTLSESGITRTSRFYLENWLAHDFLHIRQSTKLKYLYLNTHAISSIEYAGNWVL